MPRGASLHDLLKTAGLFDSFLDLLALVEVSQALFLANQHQAACNVLHKIWVHPQMVPVLILLESFGARKLIVPCWSTGMKLYQHDLAKPSGGTRPILVADLRVRVCMSVVDFLLHSSMPSWSLGTFGFRTGFGTQDAVRELCRRVRLSCTQPQGGVLLTFDLHAAFNSVNINHMAKTLQLNALPGDMKHLIWKWHHTPIKGSTAMVSGLAQGFAYSPTLFAWYLDSLVVKDSPFVAYADNFAGVFPNMLEAKDALNRVEAVLQGTGLNIGKSTIQLRPFGEYTPLYFNWLGFDIALPTGRFDPVPCKQNEHKTEPRIITLGEWETKLHNEKWLSRVMKNDWRRLS
jgi:hypothetical protein